MASNPEPKVNKKSIEGKLECLKIEHYAKADGFYKSKPKKIKVSDLLLSFFIMAMPGQNTFSFWAQSLSRLIGETVSKTGVWKRVNKALVAVLKSVLEEAFKQGLSEQSLFPHKKDSVFATFSDVHFQDSSIISLPDELHCHYKGSVSNGKQKSSIRIQATISPFSGFKLFDISSFTDNDQKASYSILDITKQGDLVVRDLGYHVLKVFRLISEKKAFYLSRYHHGTKAYCSETGKALVLSKLFSKNRSGVVDIPILLGKKENLPCRVVAIKVPGHVAAERKRKAKANRDKRLNFSEEHLKLLEWAIFITNVGDEVWGWAEIMQAYRSRWYIEIVFKGWKSHFNIAGLIPEAPSSNKLSPKDLARYKIRVDAIIYAMLIFVMLFHVHIYHYWVFKIWQKYGRAVSLLKLCSFVSNNIERIYNSEDIDQFEHEIAYYTCYEKRKKRLNQLEICFLCPKDIDLKQS